MLVTYNNWNIIKFTNKNTYKEDFNEIHKVSLDGTSENIIFLVHIGKYGVTTTIYPITMGYYVVNFISDTVKLQGGNNTYGKLFISVRITVKTHTP